MILKYNFSRVYNNAVLENLLDTILGKILHTIDLKYVITAYKKEVFLHVEVDDGKAEEFSDEFSKLLPISLFYRFLKVEVVENMPEPTAIEKCDINLPFTHTMLLDFLDENGKNYLNVTMKEDVGKSLHVKNETKEDFIKKIDESIKLLKDGNIIKISTRFGVKSVGIVSEKTKKFLTHPFTIMPCDFSVISKMVIATKSELQALISLEKPIVNLRVNLIYKGKNILLSDWVDVMMCDSLLLYLLCKKLFESGEEFIFLSDEKFECKKELVFKQGHIAKSLHVNILENDAVVMVGENDYSPTNLLPAFQNKSHERFTSILYEYELYDKKSLSFFLSHKYDDSVMFYSQNKGLIDLINIELPDSFEKLIESISKSETGEKLIKNYEKKYNNLLTNALHVNIPSSPKNFYTLLGVAGVLLGYGDEVESAAQNLISHAKNFLGSKSVRIDVKLKDDKLPNTLNVERFIQSGLSFKLADVEPQTLSYGYIESISFFVSDMADSICKELEAQNVSMCGELFSFKRLLENSAKHILPNHKLYINKAFSLE